MKMRRTHLLTSTEVIQQAAMQLAMLGLSAGLTDDETFENFCAGIEKSSDEISSGLFNLALQGKPDQVNKLFTKTLRQNLLMDMFKYIIKVNPRAGMKQFGNFIRNIHPAWHRCFYEAVLAGYVNSAHFSDHNLFYRLILATDDWMLSYKLAQILKKRLGTAVAPDDNAFTILALKNFAVQVRAQADCTSRDNFENTALALISLGRTSVDYEDGTAAIPSLCRAISNIYLKTTCELQAAASSGNIEAVNAILEARITRNLFADMFKTILNMNDNTLMTELETILPCLLNVSLAWENYFYDLALQNYKDSGLYQTPDALLILIEATQDNTMIEYLNDELTCMLDAEARAKDHMKLFQQNRRGSLELSVQPKNETRAALSRSI